MRIHIKNMICPVYLHLVKLELARLGISYKTILLDKADLSDNISESKLKKLNLALLPYNIYLQYDERSLFILKIKTVINNYLDNPEIQMKTKLDKFLSQRTYKPFYNLNFIFQEETGATIEEYYNSKKIEHAIKLFIHYNLTLTEISYQLNYVSEQELINQFKKNTGLTPEGYKKLNSKIQNVKEKILV